MTKCLLVAKHGDYSKRLIPNKIFPIFGSRFRLGFLWDASIFLLSFFIVRRRVRVMANSSFSKIPKMELLSPIANKLDVAYATNIAEDNSRESGHVVKLSF
jgi:hypothetical protein